ncbi:MAG: thrombospondin type 3 repeat-containing protein [Dehalococcoidia bacterium]
MAGKRIAVFSLLALVGLALALFASSGTHAGTFKPFTNFSLTSSTGGATSDSNASVGIAGNDYNYEDSSMLSFYPEDFTTAPGVTIPIGAGVGVLDAIVNISVAGTSCNQRLTPPETSFALHNASVDIYDELSQGECTWILTTTPPPDVNPANGLPDYLDRYPFFLNDMLDPDGDGPLPALQPIARYAGDSMVAGNAVIIQFLVFSPGQFTTAGSVYSQMGSELGIPTFIVLDNPFDEDASPGAIHDFCTPLETSIDLYGLTTDGLLGVGVGAGYTRGTNAPDATGVLNSGTHMYRNYSRTERDADGDGFENDLDPCPFTVDAGWDARLNPPQTGDADGDGLPDSCDPDDGTVNADEDYDGYSNRQDNCPLVKNGLATGQDNQADSEPVEAPDQGPGPDAIGDACDDSDDDGLEDFGTGGGTTPGSGNCNDGADNDGDGKIDGNDDDCKPYMDKGEIADAHTPAEIWGDYPQDGAWSHRMPWSAAYVGPDPGTNDSDGDGYSDALENALGSNPNDGSESDGSTYGGANCLNAIDDDSDGWINDGCPMIGFKIESATECAKGDAVSTDHGPSRPADILEESIMVAVGCGAGGCVNDGCPVIGVPESLVIDKYINAPMAQAPTKVPQTCDDGVDNDGDDLLDGADNTAKGCDESTYGTDDDDRDGVPDGSDNCPTDWNPTQTNTDGDSQGDACDTDDDDDGFSDAVEWWTQNDSLDDCSSEHAAWPLDMNQDKKLSILKDVLKYRGNIGKTVAEYPEIARPLDVNADGKISILKDVLKYRGHVGDTCVE